MGSTEAVLHVLEGLARDWGQQAIHDLQPADLNSPAEAAAAAQRLAGWPRVAEQGATGSTLNSDPKQIKNVSVDQSNQLRSDGSGAEHVNEREAQPCAFAPYLQLESVLRGIAHVLQSELSVGLDIEDLEPGEAWGPDIVKLRVSHRDLGDLGIIYLDCGNGYYGTKMVRFPVHSEAEASAAGSTKRTTAVASGSNVEAGSSVAALADETGLETRLSQAARAAATIEASAASASATAAHSASAASVPATQPPSDGAMSSSQHHFESCTACDSPAIVAIGLSSRGILHGANLALGLWELLHELGHAVHYVLSARGINGGGTAADAEQSDSLLEQQRPYHFHAIWAPLTLQELPAHYFEHYAMSADHLEVRGVELSIFFSLIHVQYICLPFTLWCARMWCPTPMSPKPNFDCVVHDN